MLLYIFGGRNKCKHPQISLRKLHIILKPVRHDKGKERIRVVWLHCTFCVFRCLRAFNNFKITVHVFALCELEGVMIPGLTLDVRHIP